MKGFSIIKRNAKRSLRILCLPSYVPPYWEIISLPLTVPLTAAALTATLALSASSTSVSSTGAGDDVVSCLTCLSKYYKMDISLNSHIHILCETA